MRWGWFLFLGMLLQVGLSARLELPQAVRLAQTYLGQPLEPYKVELKRKGPVWVWELRLGEWEVWVDAQSGQVAHLRPKKAPPHTRHPHLPFTQAWQSAERVLGSVEKLELKPYQRLALWEAKGPRGKIYILPDGRTSERRP
ncbi:PepSY domain-containing protein [Calidithermus roseus]|uniref:Peptidase propeptide and YPEB domain protein n=1 Tax=Calidithermus roseus TaxID=1644118 RepID=A0A399ELC8_9DEIN|nr:PepSY domain-containing protein [Calidithermus roseus]RIH84273.1 hypothetical protein Mrose_02704 [Calidithermus roseus]